MATVEELTMGARVFLRDFPQYFEVDEGPVNVLTFRLPHPLIDGPSLQVFLSNPADDPPVTTKTEEWQLDERNGLLKLTNEEALNQQVLVSGYHFVWFDNSELRFHINTVIHEMSYYGDALDTMEPIEAELISMGAVVHALWSLALELSLDIDVSTPEGMYIPARQRYQQVLQLMQYWEQKYNEKSAMLNIGLGSLSIFKLRRVAYMTGRYVPVYKDREFDDPKPPQRLYPAIPEGVPGSQDREVEEVTMTRTIEEIGREGQDLGFGGWTSIGTRGG